MDTSDALSRIIEILDPLSKSAKPLTAETQLSADLNIDSARAMELIMEIEDSFEIDININQVGDLNTVGDLVRLVEQHTGDAA